MKTSTKHNSTTMATLGKLSSQGGVPAGRRRHGPGRRPVPAPGAHRDHQRLQLEVHDLPALPDPAAHPADGPGAVRRRSSTSAPPGAAARSTCTISASRCWTIAWKTASATRSSKGVATVKIFSNGSLLNEPHARGLIDAGLDEIKISFDGASKEEFERIRFPLKFDVVMENVQRLVELRDRRGLAAEDLRHLLQHLRQARHACGCCPGRSTAWCSARSTTGPARTPATGSAASASPAPAVADAHRAGQRRRGPLLPRLRRPAPAGPYRRRHVAPRRLAGAGLPGRSGNGTRTPGSAKSPCARMLEVVLVAGARAERECRREQCLEGKGECSAAAARQFASTAAYNYSRSRPMNETRRKVKPAAPLLRRRRCFWPRWSCCAWP